jgi:hypothetical protein
MKEVLMKNLGFALGSFVGLLAGAANRALNNKVRFIAILIPVYFLVNNITIFDSEVHDALTMFFLFSITGLILAAFSFRAFLVGRGALKIITKVSTMINE